MFDGEDVCGLEGGVLMYFSQCLHVIVCVCVCERERLVVARVSVTLSEEINF